ncbi:hypothetical protein LguiA_022135 [Lonicera macranthoides]
MDSTNLLLAPRPTSDNPHQPFENINFVAFESSDPQRIGKNPNLQGNDSAEAVATTTAMENGDKEWKFVKIKPR